MNMPQLLKNHFQRQTIPLTELLRETHVDHLDVNRDLQRPRHLLHQCFPTAEVPKT